jgi:hypothetical protein
MIFDVGGDENPAGVDLTSSLASGIGTFPSVYYAVDNQKYFFRMRLIADPTNAGAGGFSNSGAYLMSVGVGGTTVGAIGLNAKPSAADFVYITYETDNLRQKIYEFPFGETGGQKSRGARIVPDGNGQFFLDIFKYRCIAILRHFCRSEFICH